MHCHSARQQNRRSDNKQEPSCVLLVCIYDTIALQVNNQLVYQKFSKYGAIVKVLIFEKGEVTKLFVEFGEVKHAQQAKSALDGTKLLGAICKMNIYFSNFTNVDLKNDTSEGADFSFHEEMKNQFVRGYDNLSRSYEGGDNADFLEDNNVMDAFGQFPIARSKTDNPRRLQEQISSFNANQATYEQRNMHHSQSGQGEQEVQNMIHHGINNILEHEGARSTQEIVSTKSTHSNSNTAERINPSLKIKESAQTKSPILCYELREDIKIRCIYNLFSNFGNISFICKKNRRAYIKFRTVEFAAIAYTYLNDYLLMGSLLKLHLPYSPQQANPMEGQYCECVFFDESYDRFTPNRSLTVNSPSQTLHVSSLKKDICRQHILKEIFGDWGRVEAVKILCYSNEKNMALVRFSSMEASFEAIANLHNQVFNGRKMQISFTKSRV